jgi:hypothetical protein
LEMALSGDLLDTQTAEDTNKGQETALWLPALRGSEETWPEPSWLLSSDSSLGGVCLIESVAGSQRGGMPL